MLRWAAFAALPVVAFLAAFGATWLTASAESSGVLEGELIVSLEQESRLPASYLFSVALDGSDRRAITALPPGGRFVSAVDMQPHWSTAAGLIVFARETFTAAGLGSPTKIYTVRPDGSQLRRLTEGPAVDRYPAWSPDGRGIALARDTEGAFEIFVMNRWGREFTQLTSGSSTADEFPAWSPDGRMIVYTSTVGRNEDLHVMNADGSDRRPLLAAPADDSAPAWSPDGTQIAFLRDGHVHVMAADGSDVRALTRGRPGLARPGWSPDGKSIVTGDDRGSVLVIEADGGSRTRVPIRGSASDPFWKGGGQK